MKKAMGTKFVAFVIAFFCVLAANNSEGNRNLADSHLDSGVSWDLQEFDKFAAEQVLNHCRKELKDCRLAVKDFNFLNKGVEFDSVIRVIHKAAVDLPPKKKETILDCLRNENAPVRREKPPHGTLSSECLKKLPSDCSNIPRRYLRRRGGKKGKKDQEITADGLSQNPESSQPPVDPNMPPGDKNADPNLPQARDKGADPNLPARDKGADPNLPARDKGADPNLLAHDNGADPNLPARDNDPELSPNDRPPTVKKGKKSNQHVTANDSNRDPKLPPREKDPKLSPIEPDAKKGKKNHQDVTANGSSKDPESSRASRAPDDPNLPARDEDPKLSPIESHQPPVLKKRKNYPRAKASSSKDPELSQGARTPNGPNLPPPDKDPKPTPFGSHPLPDGKLPPEAGDDLPPPVNSAPPADEKTAATSHQPQPVESPTPLMPDKSPPPSPPSGNTPPSSANNASPAGNTPPSSANNASPGGNTPPSSANNASPGGNTPPSSANNASQSGNTPPSSANNASPAGNTPPSSASNASPAGNTPPSSANNASPTGNTTPSSANNASPARNTPQSSANNSSPAGNTPPSSTNNAAPAGNTPPSSASNASPTGNTPPSSANNASPAGNTPPSSANNASPAGNTPPSSANNASPASSLPLASANNALAAPSHGNYNGHTKYIVIAVASTAVAVLSLLALLVVFCMLRKKKRVEPKDVVRDEKPLLNICTSDISAGSSQKSQAMANASGGNNIKASSTVGGSLGVGNSSGVSSSSGANPGSSQGGSQSTGASMQSQSAGKSGSGALPPPPGRPPPPPPNAPGSGPGPTPPPPPPPKLAAPAPPPPPKIGRRPPNPPPGKTPSGPHHRRASTGGSGISSSSPDGPSKTKLKPFFWDKVMASPDHTMVWHEIKAGSFQFNEEMMETLFGYQQADKNKMGKKKEGSSTDSPKLIQIIDPKKAQNLSILLKALNVTTEEVSDALNEGNELPPELIQTLLKMAPTQEEELKLRLYSGDLALLGPAERFLKVIVGIPFAFKRLEALMFVSTFQEESSMLKEAFVTLEAACKELKNSRLFLKLLEAVLKTGNRMNDGTFRGGAQAFKLDTLLKLSDVKGTDGKTTLLHFVVQEIIRSEGVRAARRLKESKSMSSVKTEDLMDEPSNESVDYHRSLGLQVVSRLSSELQNVKKTATIDNEAMTETVAKFGRSFTSTKAFIDNELKDIEGECEFREALKNFIENTESEIKVLIQEEKRVSDLIKSTGDYFHGKAGKDEGSHLFAIVREFLVMVDKACKDIKSSMKLPTRAPRKEGSNLTPSPSESAASPPPCSLESTPESSLDMHRQLFPAMRAREMEDDFSSGDDK